MSSIRIKPSTGTGSGTTASGRVDGGSSGGRHHAPATAAISSAGMSFDAALEATELQELLDRLYDLSDRLSVFPAARLIEEYRTVLTQLLRRAMQGLRIKRDLRWRKTDRKMYVTIERVEDAMDELEEAFTGRRAM